MRSHRSSAFGMGRNQSFDHAWQFHLGEDAPSDDEWRHIDLPHDWSIEELDPVSDSVPEVPVTAVLWSPPDFSSRVGPFDRDRSAGGSATGWAVGGVGWYRRQFTLAELPDDACVAVRFDGVLGECTVWLNGHELGRHVYGYTPFGFELTPWLDRDGTNLLTVRVRNLGDNSRWYTGSGIYRHARLDVTGPLRIAEAGVVVESQLDDEDALVRITVAVEGPHDHAHLETRIVDPDGKVVATSMTALQAETVAEFRVENASRWSPDEPALYEASIILRFTGGDGPPVDEVMTRFGIRHIDVDTARGLLINDVPHKLRGGCVHHDNGLLGAAAIDTAEFRRVELLKARGFNAIRCAHNPPSPAFLDACDQLGLLVIDEAFDQWNEAKRPDDYSCHFAQEGLIDIASMVLRDRNHPSVVMWSVGNEIPEKITPRGVETQAALAGECRRWDSTRLVTQSIDNFAGRPVEGRNGQPDQPATVFLDTVGYNYSWRQYEADHRLYPDRIMYGSESHAIEMWSNWDCVERLPYVLGDFVWSAVDYLGEAGIGAVALEAADGPVGFLYDPGYPWFVSYSGDLDITGRQKAPSFARDVLWGLSALEVAVCRPAPAGHRELRSLWGWWDELPSWNWAGHDGDDLTVHVYTSGDGVELRLNGDVVGAADLDGAPTGPVAFSVAFEPGELTVVAWRAGEEIGRRALRTTGAASRLELRAERDVLKPDRNDLGYVHIGVVDEHGQRVPEAMVEVAIDVAGPAELVALGSGNPLINGGFQGRSTRTFRGHCLAIVRPFTQGGHLLVTARSPSLETSSVQLTVADD
jgi:beta-galactosidase